jgi:hypothetical protein
MPKSVLNKIARIQRQADRLYESVNENRRWDATAIICLMIKNLKDIETEVVNDKSVDSNINLKTSKN